jgi:hypothetical protein
MATDSVITTCREALRDQIEANLADTDYWFSEAPPLEELVPIAADAWAGKLPRLFLYQSEPAVPYEGRKQATAQLTIILSFTIQGYVAGEDAWEDIERLEQDTRRAIFEDLGLGCAGTICRWMGSDFTQDIDRRKAGSIKRARFAMDLEITTVEDLS